MPPAGQISHSRPNPVQYISEKYSAFADAKISCISRRVPLHTEGRLAIVTNAERDAMDVEMPLTNGIDTDGEVVWS